LFFLAGFGNFMDVVTISSHDGDGKFVKKMYLLDIVAVL
jgi:hypothetical protein